MLRVLKAPAGWRRPRGLSVFSALLALALLGVMLVSGVRYLEEWGLTRRHAAAAQDLVVLARAARAHAANDLDAMRAATGLLGLREVALATLSAEGWLFDGFRTTNALGQSYRVFHRRVGTDGLELLVTTVTPAGTDVGYRLDVGYEGAREIFVGVVDPGAMTAAQRGRLLGPAVDADVRLYRAQFGEPSVGETAAITSLTMRSVYGSELHRLQVAGRPEANRMETDLVMGGHDVVGAEHIESVEADISDELRVLGGLEVTELLVGQRMTVTGDSEFEGDLRARTGEFLGAVASGSGEITNEIRAQTLDIGDTVTGRTVRASVAMSAPAVTADEVNAARVVADDVRSNDIEALTVQAQLVRGGQVRGDSGVFGQVVTGSCSGC